VLLGQSLSPEMTNLHPAVQGPKSKPAADEWRRSVHVENHARGPDELHMAILPSDECDVVQPVRLQQEFGGAKVVLHWPAKPQAADRGARTLALGGL